MTIRKILDELGLYAAPPRGKRPIYSPEEALRVKRQQQTAALRRARAVDRERREAGLEPLVRRRGRPRIYATVEEAKAVLREQNAECRRRMEARVEEALLALKPILDSARLDSARGATEDNDKGWRTITNVGGLISTRVWVHEAARSNDQV